MIRFEQLTKVVLIFGFVLASIYAFDVQGQTCYERLDDATGQELDLSAHDLNSAACDLAAIWPQEYQLDFKVYEAGAYLHTEKYEEGLDELFEAIRTELTTQYYLIFARISTPQELDQKVVVEVNLPISDPDYPCLNTDALSGISRITQVEANRIYFEMAGVPETYGILQKRIMHLFGELLSKAIYCCEASNGLRTTTCADACEFTIEQVASWLSPDVNPNYGSDFYENLDYYSQKNREKYLELTNVSNVVLDSMSYQYIDGTLEISFDVPSVGTYHFTDELNSFAGSLNGVGITHDIS
ncbi:MAG: hypothetical protein DRR06_18510, partial [Gammaproteobacteria bacterium]